MFGRKEGIMSENDFGVKVLVRDAIRAEERAKGIKICRSAAVTLLKGKRLQEFITEAGMDYRTILHGALALGDFIQKLGVFGCEARLEGLGTVAPVVSGKFDPNDPDWKSRINITYHIRLEKDLQRHIQKSAKFYTTPMQPTCPFPHTLERTTDRPVFAGELSYGENFVIRGRRLKFDRTNPEEGVFFETIEGRTQRFRNDTASFSIASILCQVPAGVEIGRTYRLVVRAKMCRCRNIREGGFGSAITITA